MINVWFRRMILAAVAAVTVLPGAAADERTYRPALEAMPAERLDEAERAGLLFMAEEEKMARDVYTAMYELYGIPVFRNIASSEQRHMDSVIALLERYGLEIPARLGEAGVFEDEELQALYDRLTASGAESLAGAFIAGAAIEDADIADLERELAGTDNADLTLVYRNLLAGSENHMRAFIRQLSGTGASYSPQFITQARYDEIVSDLSGSRGGWGGPIARGSSAAQAGPGRGPAPGPRR